MFKLFKAVAITAVVVVVAIGLYIIKDLKRELKFEKNNEYDITILHRS